MEFVGTRKAAKALGVSPSRLIRAVWDGRIEPPQKVPGGAFGWTRQDLDRASWVLLHRSFQERRCGNE